MEKAKMSNKKKILVLAAFIVIALIVAAMLVYRNQAEKKQSQEDWLRKYIEFSASYTLGFGELPQSLEEWQAWSETANMESIMLVADGDVTNAIGNDHIGKNRLGTLAYTYESLMKINIANPESQECRELFEALMPYYEKAFLWSEGTAPQQCLERLKSLSEEKAISEIDGLAQQVSALYEVNNVDAWFTLATGGNLEMLPEEYISSSGNLESVPDYPIASSGNLQAEP